MAVVTATVQVEDLAGPTALDGVLVQVYDAAGTTFITEGTTGAPFAAGEVEFSLFGDGPGVTYTIRLSLNGWRFPAGATQTILVTDPPAPNNTFGPFGAEVGPEDPLATVVVQDDEAVPNPIDGVDVFFYTAADVFITQVVTNAQGEAAIPLAGSPSPGTDYIIRPRKDGVIFPNPAQTISVLDPLVPPDTNIFDVTGVPFEPPQSTDADMCMVFGNMTDISLNPAARIRLEFKPIPEFADAGSVGAVNPVRSSGRLLGVFHSQPALVRDHILTRPVKCDTDADGNFQVLLPRNGCFKVHIQGFEDPIEITEYILIPDAASCPFIDLLFPYIDSFTFTNNPVNVAAGDAVEVPFTFTMTNGLTESSFENQRVVEDLLEFESQDESIASVTLSSASALSVKGEASGSTTVEVARVTELVVPSQPPIAALVVTPLTVNVT